MYEKTTNRDSGQLHGTNRPAEASRDQPTSQKLGAANHGASREAQKHTVQEAAEVLGTTVDAVRGRIRRGTLDSTKVDGQVYVLLDAVSREQHSDQSPTDHTDSRQLTDAQSELVAELREQNAWLRREVERKDTIIMQMAQRIPELEAPSGPREGDQTPFEQASKGDTPPGDTEQEKRSWLHRFFFGP